MLCKHYQNGNLIPHISRCSKVIILLSYRINLFFLFKICFLQSCMKVFFFLFLSICFLPFNIKFYASVRKREISYLNWNVNKLDIEPDILGWPWNELHLFHLISSTRDREGLQQCIYDDVREIKAS